MTIEVSRTGIVVAGALAGWILGGLPQRWAIMVFGGLAGDVTLMMIICLWALYRLRKDLATHLEIYQNFVRWLEADEKFSEAFQAFLAQTPGSPTEKNPQGADENPAPQTQAPRA